MAVEVAIEITKYKEVYLDLAGVHVSLLGNLLLQVIQQDGTPFNAFSIELVSIGICNYNVANYIHIMFLGGSLFTGSWYFTT